MTIGVISDTHRRVDLAKFCIQTLKKEGAEFLIHAGDIVEEKTLELLKKSSLPYVAVLGNNDSHLRSLTGKYNLFHEPHVFNLDEYKIKLMHHPYYLTPDANIIVYGHTHHFEANLLNGTFFLNSGEVCARKKPLCECALLHVNKKRWDVTRFFCKPEKRIWKKEYWSFSE